VRRIGSRYNSITNRTWRVVRKVSDQQAVQLEQKKPRRSRFRGAAQWRCGGRQNAARQSISFEFLSSGLKKKACGGIFSAAFFNAKSPILLYDWQKVSGFQVSSLV